MIYELKVWNWLAPGIFSGAFLFAALFMASADLYGAQYCAGALFFAAVLLFVQTVSGYRAFYRQIEVDQLSQKRTALADTPEVRLAEMIRQMHPETVRLFFKHRLEVWRVKEMKGSELVTWVLDADPRINWMFFEYVLKRSNFYALMPKRMLSDKAHSFDPMRVVTDYEMYDALVEMLMRRGYVTQGFGNQPPVWIEPWKPELVARKFGIELYEEDVVGSVNDGQLSPVENKA